MKITQVLESSVSITKLPWMPRSCCWVFVGITVFKLFTFNRRESSIHPAWIQAMKYQPSSGACHQPVLTDLPERSRGWALKLRELAHFPRELNSCLIFHSHLTSSLHSFHLYFYFLPFSQCSSSCLDQWVLLCSQRRCGDSWQRGRGSALL